jgi:hypothetical protein
LRRCIIICVHTFRNPTSQQSFDAVQIYRQLVGRLRVHTSIAVTRLSCVTAFCYARILQVCTRLKRARTLCSAWPVRASCDTMALYGVWMCRQQFLVGRTMTNIINIKRSVCVFVLFTTDTLRYRDTCVCAANCRAATRRYVRRPHCATGSPARVTNSYAVIAAVRVRFRRKTIFILHARARSCSSITFLSRARSVKVFLQRTIPRPVLTV